MRGGNIDRMMREIAVVIRADSAASLDAVADADVILTHDLFSTEVALERRRAGQNLDDVPRGDANRAYAAWSWGVPEADWRSLMKLPDVSWWCDQEPASGSRWTASSSRARKRAESFAIVGPPRFGREPRGRADARSV